MSSGYVARNGNHEIAFYFRNPQTEQRKRFRLRLGRVTDGIRKQVQAQVDILVKCRELGLALPPESRVWLRGLATPLHEQLVAFGLAKPRIIATLQLLCDTHKQKLVDGGAVSSTLRNLSIVIANLTECFGGECLIKTFTTEDALRFRRWLLERDLATATISRRCRRAREIFATAIAKGWLKKSHNPFRDMKGWNETNPERDQYIPWNEFLLVLEGCSCPRFRLFLVITRTCAIRSPSDVRPICWSHIRRDLEIMRVYSKKNRKTRPMRDIPIFKELRPYIDAAHEAAPLGVDEIFHDLPATDAAINNRLEVLCRKAGFAMWPKPLTNLRASGELDLWRVKPYDEVCHILDHSPETAQRHYNRFAKELKARAEGRVHSVPDLSW